MEELTKGMRVSIPARGIEEAVVRRVYHELCFQAKIVRASDPAFQRGRWYTITLTGGIRVFPAE